MILTAAVQTTPSKVFRGPFTTPASLTGTANTSSSSSSLHPSSLDTEMDSTEILSTMDNGRPMPDPFLELRQDCPVSLPVEDTLSPVGPPPAAAENDAEYPVNVKWIGTGPNYTERAADFQKYTDLDSTLRILGNLLQEQCLSPYNPLCLLHIAGIHNRLAFSDIAVANAHRAILLIKGALGIDTIEALPMNLGAQVHIALRRSYPAHSPSLIAAELQNIHRLATIELLKGLHGLADYRAALGVANEALECWPGDPEIDDICYDIGYSWQYVRVELDTLQNSGDFESHHRLGMINRVKYPWLRDSLHYRTPALLREINAGLKNCEVRPVVFGPKGKKAKKVKEGKDVGPCGLFAKRDLAREDLILCDQSLTAVSSLPPSKLLHCDACHGALQYPYVNMLEVQYPTCCKDRVAYCSPACAKTAATGYHKVQCGKDFDWIYDAFHKQDPDSTEPKGGAPKVPGGWQGPMYLRFFSIILADKEKNQKPVHPLQHPLVACMTAKYDPIAPGKITPEASHEWSFETNLLTPTRILLQLGVDIFADRNWDQEVIQTILWRIQNNSSGTRSSATPGQSQICMYSINPKFLFLNHSCQATCSWHGASNDATSESISSRLGEDGLVKNPTSSAIFVTAGTYFGAGEELKISYVGDAFGDGFEGDREDLRSIMRSKERKAKKGLLGKWIDDGDCGCGLCGLEREEAERVERERVLDGAAEEIREKMTLQDSEAGVKGIEASGQ